MSKSTVIADWRIACELDASPDEIKAFVCIKHALRLVAPDAGIIPAVQELCRMKSWAQVAALPELCAIVLKGETHEVDAIDEFVFQPMIRRCEPSVRKPFETALEAFCAGGGPRNVIPHLREIVTALPFSVDKEPDTSHFSLDRHETSIAVLTIRCRRNLCWN